MVKSKDVFWAFMDLDNRHYRVVGMGYRLPGTSLKGLQSFYVSSRAWVRVGDNHCCLRRCALALAAHYQSGGVGCSGGKFCESSTQLKFLCLYLH